MIAERAHRLVNLKDYQTAGSPEHLGHLSLIPPAEDQYILRMVVKSPGTLYSIPEELDWIMPMFNRALEHQNQIATNHPFCYVTIRHGLVKSKKDDEWHVDGFSTKVPHTPEQNYIWANQDATEYADLNVKIPHDFDPRHHNINHYLEQHVTEALKADSNVVYCMDPYILHRRPSSTTGTQRTFVRISFVPIEINDVLNTQNPSMPKLYTTDGLAFRSQLKTY